MPKHADLVAWVTGQAEDAVCFRWVYDDMDHHERFKLRRYLLTEQNGLCPICKLGLDADAGYLDHDHQSGYVRGVLHPRCNSLVGLYETGIVDRVQVWVEGFADSIDRDPEALWLGDDDDIPGDPGT